MGEFKYQPSREVDARHRAARSATSPREKRPVEQKNVETILNLGSTRYFVFRRQVLAIPPVPWKLGQQVLAVYAKSLEQAKKVARSGDEKAVEAYYVQMRALAKLMWPHLRPARPFMRLLKRCHLTKNVLMTASEKELQEITTFFLEGRMMSNVRVMEMDESLTPMSSMNSKSS